MTMTQAHEDDFVIRIPRAGYEAAAVGGAIGVDLSGTPTDGFTTEAIEGAGGGIFTYAIYQCLLTGIRTEGYVRKGQMTRREQFKQVRTTAWEATKSGAAASIVIGVVLAACPFLVPVASIAGVVGGCIAGTRLINAGLDAFSPEMKEELKTAATNAGVSIVGLTGGDEISNAASPA
jgi:hypothetical protein